MLLCIRIRKKYLFIILGILIFSIIFASIILRPSMVPALSTIFVDEEVEKEIQQIFADRNLALLDQDKDALKKLYDQNIKYGVWAYEHELKKMKYLHAWSEKQGVDFTNVNSKVVVKWTKEKGEKTAINLLASTEYEYRYENEPKKSNYFRIGTYHSLDLKKYSDGYKIVREWYTDPFADSLHLDERKTAKSKEYILSQEKRDMSNIIERRKKALAYADKYCGAAAEKEYIYNKKYKNYNPLGGDCANFASQILFEGGNFKKTYAWRYRKEGSKAWINAHAFKNYMIHSKRASVVAYGTYDQVYKAAYKLLPGDFVAYEKKGKVTHISVISGADSKGYSLVNSHNTDRFRVPWDLGFSDKKIKFWLVHVHF